MGCSRGHRSANLDQKHVDRIPSRAARAGVATHGLALDKRRGIIRQGQPPATIASTQAKRRATPATKPRASAIGNGRSRLTTLNARVRKVLAATQKQARATPPAGR